MIFITLSAQRAALLNYPNEPSVKWVGYSFNATDSELWDHNKGVWRLGARVNSEEYVALCFEGEVKLVAHFSVVALYPNSSRYFFVGGRPLTKGEAPYDKWIGQPVKGTRNPIRYEYDPDIDGWKWKTDKGVAKVLDDLQAKYPRRDEFLYHLKNI